MTKVRADREIAHGKKLAHGDPELVWGWGTAAGKLRAVRRAEIIAAGGCLAPGISALEIGCGTGLLTEMFAQTGASLVAVDISADLLEKARSRSLPANRVQFLETRFEHCEAEGPFDAVIGSSVLHHLDLNVSLARIFALLKPGGAMSFAEPNMLNPQILLQKNVTWLKRRLGDTPDETAFVRFRLRKLLLQAGFYKVDIKPLDWLHPATPPLLMKTVGTIGSILEKIPLIREFAGSLFIRARRPEN